MELKLISTLRKFSFYPNMELRGRYTKEFKRTYLEKLKKRFKSQKFRYPSGLKENKKTLSLLRIIADANEKTNELLSHYGMSEIFIPVENIHIFGCSRNWKKFCFFLKDPDLYDSQGFYFWDRGLIGIIKDFDKNILKFIIFHEIIHYKSFCYLAEPAPFGRNRLGLQVGKMGSVLNEAITDILATCLTGVPTIEYLGNHELKVASVGLLINKIFTRNPDKFTSESEAFELFVRAMFTGNLLPLARIIRKSFPDKKDVFRKLFWLNTDAHLRFVQSL